MGNEQGRVLSPEELRAREISQMDSEVKKKLSQTKIKYNLKVVIKGDRNTGKTCLWRRLQGLPFTEEYIPTPEIQVAHINWSYKAVSDDIVKVEVWDVVDKAKPKKKNSLKISSGDQEDTDDNATLPPPTTQQGSFSLELLDANTVDVLKGAHAVIVMVDPTKKWTWDYAQKEVAKIPKDVYVLVLAGYRDFGEHRVVSEYEIKDFCKQQGNMIKVLEASMLNGYGLKSVICLKLILAQRQYIQAQLDRNMDEIHTAEEELQVVTTNQGYDFYLKWLESSKKKPTAQHDVSSQFSRVSVADPQIADVPIPIKTKPVNTNKILKKSDDTKTQPTVPAKPSSEEAQKKIDENVLPVKPPIPTDETPKKSDDTKNQPAPTKSLFSRISGMVGGIGTSSSKPQPVKEAKPVQPQPEINPSSIEEYNTGNLDDEFFGDGHAIVSPFEGSSGTPTIDKRPSFNPVEIREKEGEGEGEGEGGGEEEPNPLVAQDEYMDEFPSPLASMIRAPNSGKPNMKKNTSQDKIYQQKSPSNSSRTKSPATQPIGSSVNPALSKGDKKLPKTTEVASPKPGVIKDKEFDDNDESPKITKNPVPKTQQSPKTKKTPPTKDQEDTLHTKMAHDTFVPEEADSKELDSFFDDKL